MPRCSRSVLHVLDQVPGGVVRQRGERPAAAGAALVEYHDAIPGRIEESAGAYIASPAGTAVHEDRGLALGIAALLVVDRVVAADEKRSLVKGFQRRVKDAPGLHIRLALIERVFEGGGRAEQTVCWPSRRRLNYDFAVEST